MSEERVLFEHESIARTLRRLALEIVDATRGTERLALVGIRRGGVPIAARLAALIAESEGKSVPVGSLEIALYRDDAATALPDPKIGPSHIEFDVNGRDVVLVDDVLQTGRTVRAAIDGLLDYGRPRRIWLAALFDRGGRELPIAADFVGRPVELAPGEKLFVEIGEGSDRAWVRGRS
ncbi:MAG: bifunctional pyr operon transcriptional regulator/uracil phosphoribosyltransferase PyrR [Deltaproteobacteria bacterium]|nr:bifunctional pyr operon transcriptional regulator/uracil phosphoribosyltransferase PyrR [Deltaproteobacteria bacterium]